MDKKCIRCRETKAVDHFSKRKDRLQSWCKSCANAYSKNRVQENPKKHYASVRKWDLQYKYGMTLEQYSEMFSSQGGVCAVCKRPETAVLHGVVKRLSVDHCHVTGLNRGLLCSRCNPMLGYAEDNIETLEAAIAYLRSY